jgi:uncharacterized membrane protein
MSERTLRILAAALALVGAAIASYLLYVRYSGGAPACASGGCETVQRSRYAEIAGFPVAGLGLVGYLGILAAAIVPGERARLAQAVLGLTAVGFGTYLLFVQLHSIGAVCDWCLASDGVTTGLAALALLRLNASARVPAGTAVWLSRNRSRGRLGCGPQHVRRS